MSKHLSSVAVVGGSDLEAVDRDLARAEARLERMVAANHHIARWGALRAAPELSKLGYRREQVSALLAGGKGSLGFTEQDLAAAEVAVMRLTASRALLAQHAGLSVQMGDHHV